MATFHTLATHLGNAFSIESESMAKSMLDGKVTINGREVGTSGVGVPSLIDGDVARFYDGRTAVYNEDVNEFVLDPAENVVYESIPEPVNNEAWLSPIGHHVRIIQPSGAEYSGTVIKRSDSDFILESLIVSKIMQPPAGFVGPAVVDVSSAEAIIYSAGE